MNSIPVNGSEAAIGIPTLSDALTCGLIMPISAIDGCASEHWADVKSIITEAVESISNPKFNVRLVSDADDVGVIQKRIVQNVYSSNVVVCDVSGKNPNVMFELGLRLAFDKPTVIVKDDKTDYSFDTGVIEHVSYPRDLRFNRMVAFKTVLAEKVAATYRASIENPEHSTFLKSFGQFHVASLSQDVVPADKVVVEMLSEMQTELTRVRQSIAKSGLRLREKDPIEGAIRVKAELDRYLSENPKTDLTSLIASAEFQREIESKASAPRYFESSRHFRETLDKAVRDALSAAQGT
jgi:hypothetical protein